MCLFLTRRRSKCYEALIETRDDVTDWAEDEARGSFNVLLMMARLHGRAGAREAVLRRVAKVLFYVLY